jgi:hypothetical protein
MSVVRIGRGHAKSLGCFRPNFCLLHTIGDRLKVARVALSQQFGVDAG